MDLEEGIEKRTWTWKREFLKAYLEENWSFKKGLGKELLCTSQTCRKLFSVKSPTIFKIYPFSGIRKSARRSDVPSYF